MRETLKIEVDLKKKRVYLSGGEWYRGELNLPPTRRRYELVMYGPWPRDAHDNPVWASKFLQAIADTFFFAKDFVATDDSSEFWGTSGL
jgi:hypothetical protein